MTSEAQSIERYEEITDPRIIPNGVYPGVWGGYEVRTVIDGWKVRIATKEGIRTHDAECEVHVRNGVVWVKCP